MNLFMLSEISQRKTNTVWFHLYVEFKKQNEWLTETVMQTAVCQRGGWGQEWIDKGD